MNEIWRIMAGGRHGQALASARHRKAGKSGLGDGRHHQRISRTSEHNEKKKERNQLEKKTMASAQSRNIANNNGKAQNISRTGGR